MTAIPHHTSPTRRLNGPAVALYALRVKLGLSVEFRMLGNMPAVVAPSRLMMNVAEARNAGSSCRLLLSRNNSTRLVMATASSSQLHGRERSVANSCGRTYAVATVAN